MSCNTKKTTPQKAIVISKTAYQLDSNLNRNIPMEIYENISDTSKKGLVILNAGYGCSNTEYTYIARFLASKNYLVIATHHEQETDPMLPSGEDLYTLRLPNWKEGVLNIELILNYLEDEYSWINLDKINLIGHSNGGDIACLYASTYPDKIASLITSIDFLTKHFISNL